MAVDVDVRFGNLPFSGRNLAAFYLEGASFFELAEESTAKSDRLRQPTGQFLNAVLLFIEDHGAGHCGKHFGFPRGRVEVRIWAKAEGDFARRSFIDSRPNERVGQQFGKSARLLIVVATVAALLGLRLGISGESVHSLSILCLLFWRQRLSIDLERLIDLAIGSLDD